ncbi:MAG: PAS domain-containing sensor histidine kinase [Panacagrimonas sp.]
MPPVSDDGHQANDNRPLQALLGAAVDAIVMIDSRGIVTRFNPSAERLFGFTAEEVIGQNVRLLMPEPVGSQHDGYLANYLRTRQARIIGIGREVTACRKDGSTFPVDLSVGEFRNGEDRGFVGILRDISVRKSRELELKRTTQRMRLMFEHGPTPKLLSDQQGRIADINRACRGLLRFSRHAVRGMDLVALLHPDDRRRVSADLATLGAAGGTQRRNVRVHTHNGDELFAILHTACARDNENGPCLFITEIIDQTAIHHARHEADSLRERLVHAGRLGSLGEMVSGIAHELNQPLTAIGNYASASKRMIENQQQADIPGILEKISAQADRAGQIIRGLRALAKPKEAMRETLNINQLIEEVVQLVDFQFRGAGLDLDIRMDAHLPRTVGDSVQIQQVMINLLNNAIDAIVQNGVGSQVRLSTRQAERGWIEIRIEDDGPGLTAEVEKRLFDPFVTTKQQGMGLGLSICASIISAHRGQLKHSRRPGAGACFVIRLPEAEQDDP